MSTVTALLDMSVKDFLAAAAAKTPTPGGGSVAALAGALGAALAQMSLNYSVGKKSLEAFRPELEAALGRFSRAQAMLVELVAEDIAAYDALSKWMKIPKDQREGDAEFVTVLTAAIRVPETIGGVALAIMTLAEEILPKTNPMLVSDLVLAAAMANAAARGAELNVLANLPLLSDAAESAATRKRAADMVAKADAAWTRIRAAMNTPA